MKRCVIVQLAPTATVAPLQPLTPKKSVTSPEYAGACGSVTAVVALTKANVAVGSGGKVTTTFVAGSGPLLVSAIA
jgi:hypothetical protein